MDSKAMFKLSYGLFVLTTAFEGRDNGCIRFFPHTRRMPARIFTILVLAATTFFRNIWTESGRTRSMTREFL